MTVNTVKFHLAGVFRKLGGGQYLHRRGDRRVRMAVQDDERLAPWGATTRLRRRGCAPTCRRAPGRWRAGPRAGRAVGAARGERVLALAFQAIVRRIVDASRRWACSRSRRRWSCWRRLPALFGLEAGADALRLRWGAAAGDERAARGSRAGALVAGLRPQLARRGQALFVLAPEICARFHKPEATHLLRLAALALPLSLLHEPRVRRLRARLRPDGALVDDRGGAEPDRAAAR